MLKAALLSLLVLLSAALLVGCVSVPAPVETTPAPTAAPTTKAPVKTEAPTTEAPVTEPATTETPVTEPATTEAPVTEPATTAAPETEPAREESELLKGYDWTDGVIVIDGVLYQSFDDNYSKFPENGWDFEFGDRTVKESDVLNAHTYVIGGVRLYNEKYPGSSSYSRPSIYISFYNNSSENLPYKSCNVLGIEVDGCSGYDTWEANAYSPCECYDFEIPRGIHRGSTLEEVKAAYGEPDNVYVAEDHYEVLTYSGDHIEYKLTVHYDSGLQGVDINDSRQWVR